MTVPPRLTCFPVFTLNPALSFPALLHGRCICCSTFWTDTSAPSPVLAAPCTGSFGWKNIPECATIRLAWGGVPWSKENALCEMQFAAFFSRDEGVWFVAVSACWELPPASPSAGGSLAQIHSAVGCWISPSLCVFWSQPSLGRCHLDTGPTHQTTCFPAQGLGLQSS